MLLQNTVTEITENQIAEMLKIFDQNGDQIISRDEFVEGLKKYINEAKHAVDRKYLRTESLKNMYEVCYGYKCIETMLMLLGK